MAGWISSKLKVAETLLHQIDQQAAESLGKGDKKQSDGFDFNTSPKPSGSVSLRDQLKKKTFESNDETFGKFSSNYQNNISTRELRELSSDDNSNHKKMGKEVMEPSSNPRPTLKDSDWTELLSTPKQPIRANVRKVGGKVGNVKDNGKAVRMVRREGAGNGGKANFGGRSEIPGALGGVSSDDKPLVSSQNLGSRQKGKKMVKHEGIMGNGNQLLESGENVLAKADSSCIASNGDVLSGSNNSVNARVSNEGKEAIDYDERIRKAKLPADDPNAGIANVVSGDLKTASSGSDDVSDSDSESSSTSDSEIEREREERMRRRQQILAAKAAAKAAEAIKEQENLVACLEGEKQSLEKMLEEQAKQAALEASELQSTMIEMMQAAELEKQKHNHTRMEVLARLAKLETANADLAKSLATSQWNLEIEVNRVAEFRQQVETKEVVYEELKRGISGTHLTWNSLIHSKGIELEREMLEAEYIFVTDKISKQQAKVTKLQANIDSTQKELDSSTEVEVELQRRLNQLTDHLIQKQVQVEALSSDKAMLLFRIETVSRLLDENQSTVIDGDISGSSREDLEAGIWVSSSSKLRPMFENKIESGKQHLGLLLRQLDGIFSAGAVFLARNPAAKLWSLVYLVCLHLWVLYILFSNSQSAEEATSGAVVSLENINNTGGV